MALSGDTLVQTTDGLVDLKTLVGEDFVDFKDREIEIVNGNGQVDETWSVYRAPAYNTVKITTAGGSTLRGTYDHSIRVASDVGYLWKSLRELTVDDAPYIFTSTDHRCGVYDKISSIQVITEKDFFVYDLVLPSSSSFAANGFASAVISW